MADNGRKVTLREMNARLEKMPTRWEVRFLVLAGFLLSDFVPTAEVARAAISLF